jgi:hypothetical protein
VTYPEQGDLCIDWMLELIAIQLTWFGHRSAEVSKKLYQPSPANPLRTGRTRAQHVITDPAHRHCSFYNAEMQYASRWGKPLTGRNALIPVATVGSKYRHSAA